MASGVAGFAVFAGLILVLAAMPSRLLGVRLSLGRAVLTGGAGWRSASASGTWSRAASPVLPRWWWCPRRWRRWC